MELPYGELKRKALLAKQRMRMGYWQQALTQREDILKKVGKTENNIEMIKQLQVAQLKRETSIIINNPSINKDESLYKKVKKILDEDEFVSNPIGKLIEKEEYETLDDDAKQRYILQLSKKYTQLRERYLKERQASTL